MAIIQFSHLPEKERELLYLSPALVTYLTGGADKKLDTAEESQAKHIVHFRTSTGDPMLFDFFTEVEPKFLTQLHSLEKQYDNLLPEERTELLVTELEKLNDILPKIDPIYARTLLRSLKSLALAVAEASGGILGFLDVTYEEKHLAELPMITVEL
ncbi:MAG: hypothetical protein JWN78_1689 [Bacteroidota bacterium]|nr:hypothetical protein [Bacteroidota bacterium]